MTTPHPVRALLPLLLLIAVFAPPEAMAADEIAEKPDAVIFLPRIGRGEGAPAKKSVDTFVVLSEVTKSDPYYEVVNVLTKGTRTEVLTFDRRRLGPLFKKLSNLKPGVVAVVIRPGSLDVNFQFEFLERASRLDSVVHALIVFPVNAADRALWGGKEYVAKLRFSK